jgi:hypothetical protein
MGGGLARGFFFQSFKVGLARLFIRRKRSCEDRALVLYGLVWFWYCTEKLRHLASFFFFEYYGHRNIVLKVLNGH